MKTEVSAENRSPAPKSAHLAGQKKGASYPEARRKDVALELEVS
jgi:hypothetical protein